MKRSITRWIATLSTAAALGVPAMAVAQTPEQTPPRETPSQQTPPHHQTPPQRSPAQSTDARPGAEQAVTPEEHLRQAKAALDRIQTSSLPSGTQAKVAELERHMSALEAGDATAARKSPGTTSSSQESWQTDVAAADKIIADLLGPDPSSGASGMTGTTAGAPGATGTTGSPAAAAVAMDDATRAALTEVRSHIVAFAAAKSGTAVPHKEPKGEVSMTSPQSDTAAAARSEDPQARAASPAGAPAAEPAAAEPQDPASADAPAAAAPAEQAADTQAARRHLTAARSALNQLTQLPAAAQLTGEPRAQISQLISNFNELITTQAQWRSSFEKVATNLDSLLGPEAPASDAAAALPPASPESTAAPGAVGTTGAGASADLDPAIRAKLVEMRRHLAEFETALGGPDK